MFAKTLITARAAFMVAAALWTSCAAGSVPSVAATSATPPSSSTDVGNGQIELVVLPLYPYGQHEMRFRVNVTTTRGMISGPTSATIVVGDGSSSPGSPAILRGLATFLIRVPAGQRDYTELVWDGLNELAELVPAGRYTLAVEFTIDDGGQSRQTTMRAPLHFGP